MLIHAGLKVRSPKDSPGLKEIKTTAFPKPIFYLKFKCA